MNIEGMSGDLIELSGSYPGMGFSLGKLVRKAGSGISSAARVTQRAALRPATHLVANTARDVGASKLVRAAVNAVPGGSAALSVFDSTVGTVKKNAAPLTKLINKSQKIRADSAAAASAALKAHKSNGLTIPGTSTTLSMPLVLGIGGAVLAVGVLGFAMSGRKSGSAS